MRITSLNTALSGVSARPATATADGHGLKLGRYSERDGDTASGTLSSKVPSGTSEVFAADILEKLQAAQTASNAGALVASGAAGDLESSLADVIDTVRKRHGDAAATAVMGIVEKGVGDGGGGEDALGNALVSALTFIDRNFGIASGDAAMATFNGALNDAVNGYFQNGHDELFYASDGTGGATAQVRDVLSQALDAVAQRFGEETSQAISDLMTQSLEKTGVTRQGLGTALAAADAYLTGQYGEAGDLGLANLAGAQASLAKGSVVDLAV
ncbi:hypothetical protein [Solidesulfovibrio sp.]|uniref:hypothetical protein n=1 Tax=Solidesulfovibrio sp. TaxID=2910990 RepID=UPI002B1F05E0|nr:hypothetical protein [Solidesulfovibrio sp.]MEA4856415.1 hypothetical protein [Solidesulfovibrio sp.]